MLAQALGRVLAPHAKNHQGCLRRVGKVPARVRVTCALENFGERAESVSDELREGPRMESNESLCDIGSSVLGCATDLMAKSEIQSGLARLSFCHHPQSNLLTQLPNLEISIGLRAHGEIRCSYHADNRLALRQASS